MKVQCCTWVWSQMWNYCFRHCGTPVAFTPTGTGPREILDQIRSGLEETVLSAPSLLLRFILCKETQPCCDSKVVLSSCFLPFCPLTSTILITRYKQNYADSCELVTERLLVWISVPVSYHLTPDLPWRDALLEHQGWHQSTGLWWIKCHCSLLFFFCSVANNHFHVMIRTTHNLVNSWLDFE